MLKRTTFTSITPLPEGMSRETAVAFLHNHLEMIDLNPLVNRRHPIPAPDHAEPEERSCTWYSITDRLYYVPGLATGDVDYTCAFHNLPLGLQTHCYAPMGVDIRDKWTIGGILPGEPPQPQELGLGAPSSGLYLREDVDFRCNIVMAGFVKRTIKKAHTTLSDNMAARMRLLGEGVDAPEVMAVAKGDHALQHSNKRALFASGGADQGQPYQVPGLYEAPGAELYEAPGSEPAEPRGAAAVSQGQS
ncbi:hypothetical protein ACO1O0_003059 [Amphichorda felina]